MTQAQDVLKFWLDEMTPADWYRSDPDLDAEITKRFQQLWWDTMHGANGLWLTHPSGSLAYIVLFDQFSRNMFRDTGRAFASDPKALAAAKSAIKLNWDMQIDEPARQFFYMPLMHSESLTDQDRAVRMFDRRMPETGYQQIDHARAHREQIRRYGRFPGRNAALGRKSMPAEQTFLDAGGYGHLFRTEFSGEQGKIAS